MPVQLLNESREYQKVLDLIYKFMKSGNGNVYLRKGPSRGSTTSSVYPQNSISSKLGTGLMNKLKNAGNPSQPSNLTQQNLSQLAAK